MESKTDGAKIHPDVATVAQVAATLLVGCDLGPDQSMAAVASARTLIAEAKRQRLAAEVRP